MIHLSVLLTLSAGVLAAGQTCSEIYEAGEEACGEDMTAACLEGSQCQNLIATGLETCTEEDTVYDEETGNYTSPLAAIQEAAAGVQFACSPCGVAFMQLASMMEDESVCGGENIMSMCQVGTPCHGAKQNVTETCTDEDTYFDDDTQEDVKILDTLGGMSMLCSPCGAAFANMGSSCGDDSDANCEEGGSCQTALDAMRSQCTDEDVLPGMDDADMSLDDMLGMMDMMCGGCMVEIQTYNEECSDTPEAVCHEGSQCNNLFAGLKDHCDPHGAVENGPACMADPSSCECMVEQDPTYCYDANQTSADCSAFCSDYTHAYCDDEASCECQMLKNQGLCEACESEEGCNGCDMVCFEKIMYAFQHFGLFACLGLEQPTCVELPGRQHPIWSNPIMNNMKPRECNMMT